MLLRSRAVPSVPAEVRVRNTLPDHLTEADTQLLGRRTADEVPAVEDPVDREIREQGKGEGDGERTVALVGRLTNAELVRERERLVTEEAKARPEARLEGRLNPGGIDGDDGQATVGDFGGSVELDQFRQLKLSLGSPGAAEEREDQRPASRHILDRHRALPIIHKAERGELLTDFVLECHRKPPLARIAASVALASRITSERRILRRAARRRQRRFDMGRPAIL